VALEDYARVQTGATAAEAITPQEREVSGLHLCGLPAPVTEAVRRDIIDFARELTAASSSGGLGWS
jgi:hypothetical protein